MITIHRRAISTLIQARCRERAPGGSVLVAVVVAAAVLVDV
jgi:hypothetical protein